MGRKAAHLTPEGVWLAGCRISVVKLLSRILILPVVITVLGLLHDPASFAQDNIVSSSFPVSSAKEKLHALALTRFHFITLKQFHSALFSFGAEQHSLSDSEARILNAGLNAFLASPDRETALLEALRQNKAIQLRFSVPEQGKAYQVMNHPTKPLAYRLEPMTSLTPASIDIQPLLDEPIAFQIVLHKGTERYRYHVDWSGKVIHLAGSKGSELF